MELDEEDLFLQKQIFGSDLQNRPNSSETQSFNDGDEPDDYSNYKGIYFDEEQSEKYQDPVTGAHFEYGSICERLEKIKQTRVSSEDRELNILKNKVFELKLNLNTNHSRNTKTIKCSQTEDKENSQFNNQVKTIDSYIKNKNFASKLEFEDVK